MDLQIHTFLTQCNSPEKLDRIKIYAELVNTYNKVLIQIMETKPDTNFNKLQIQIFNLEAEKLLYLMRDLTEHHFTFPV